MSADASEPILRTEGVSKNFGRFTALKDVSVVFRRQALTSIIGPNGAGKSTYFNVISVAFPPSAGRIEFEGRDITGLPQHRFAHIGIGKSFQITNVFPQLSALRTSPCRLSCRASTSGGPGRVSASSSSRPRTS